MLITGGDEKPGGDEYPGGINALPSNPVGIFIGNMSNVPPVNPNPMLSNPVTDCSKTHTDMPDGDIIGTWVSEHATSCIWMSSCSCTCDSWTVLESAAYITPDSVIAASTIPNIMIFSIGMRCGGGPISDRKS